MQTSMGVLVPYTLDDRNKAFEPPASLPSPTLASVTSNPKSSQRKYV